MRFLAWYVTGLEDNLQDKVLVWKARDPKFDPRSHVK